MKDLIIATAAVVIGLTLAWLGDDRNRALETCTQSHDVCEWILK
jgi:hypothetical protein